MLIREVCEAAGLTKKAVEYYIEQGLIDPETQENGYRDFSAGEIEHLKKIALLRRLGLSVEEVRAVLADISGEIMKKLSVRSSIRIKQQTARQALLERLGVQQDWDAAHAQIDFFEKTMTIAERLLDAFPGYYGRFVSLHFASFLDRPIETPAQREAYDAIVRFLDHVPAFAFPVEIQEYLSESTKDIGVQAIAAMDETMKQSLGDMDAFLAENLDALEAYARYRKSDEFRNSPAYQLQTLLKEFNMTSGYYEVFIPSMKKLSPSYASYCEKLEAANEKLKVLRPDIAGVLSEE